jgi:hypothetical protein
MNCVGVVLHFDPSAIHVFPSYSFTFSLFDTISVYLSSLRRTLSSEFLPTFFGWNNIDGLFRNGLIGMSQWLCCRVQTLYLQSDLTWSNSKFDRAYTQTRKVIDRSTLFKWVKARANSKFVIATQTEFWNQFCCYARHLLIKIWILYSILYLTSSAFAKKRDNFRYTSVITWISV